MNIGIYDNYVDSDGIKAINDIVLLKPRPKKRGPLDVIETIDLKGDPYENGAQDWFIGDVVSVGPGVWGKKGFKRTEVKEGDAVLYKRHDGEKVEDLLVFREKDLLGVVDEC